MPVVDLAAQLYTVLPPPHRRPADRHRHRPAAQVTCGSTIKLESGNTQHRLHSHEVSYGYDRGSGQQSVTGYPDHESAGSLWTVRSDGVSAAAAPAAAAAGVLRPLSQLLTLQLCAARPSCASCSRGRCRACRSSTQPTPPAAAMPSCLPACLQCCQGTPIKKGQEVRLQHIQTRRWLHSHLFSSPLSNNQEVSCFGDDANTDSGDVWVVEWDGGKAAWQRDAPVRLVHKDTGAFLSNHRVAYQRPIPGTCGLANNGLAALRQRSGGAQHLRRRDWLHSPCSLLQPLPYPPSSRVAHPQATPR